MKVRYLQACRIQNPNHEDFPRHQVQLEFPDGTKIPPASVREMDAPIGTINSGPDSWRLCIPESIMIMKRDAKTGKLVPTNKFRKGPIRAEPIDDEAKQMVLKKAPHVAKELGIAPVEEPSSEEVTIPE